MIHEGRVAENWKSADPLMQPLAGQSVLVAHPSAELYGSDRVLLESVVGLVQAGARVSVMVPCSGPLVGALRDSGARVLEVPIFVLRRAMLSPHLWPSSAALLLRSIRATLKQLSTAPDLVYVNTVTVPVPAIMARMAGKRLVVHVHEAEGYLPKLQRLVLSISTRVAHRVIFNSETSRSVVLESSHSARRRGAVVYNAVTGPREAVPPRRHLEGPLRLLYVGRISPRKGTDVAIESLRILLRTGVDATLDLLGDTFAGYEWYAQRLARAIEESGLSTRVRWLGFTDDIWPTVAASDILLIPSRAAESFGNAAVEAVLAARPVVVTDVGGLPEAVRGVPSSIVVPPDDPDGLARAVRTIANEWEQYRAEAISAARPASLRFDPQRYRDDVVEVVSALVAEHPSLVRQGAFRN